MGVQAASPAAAILTNASKKAQLTLTLTLTVTLTLTHFSPSPNPIPNRNSNPNPNPNPLHYPFRNVGIAVVIIAADSRGMGSKCTASIHFCNPKQWLFSNFSLSGEHISDPLGPLHIYIYLFLVKSDGSEDLDRGETTDPTCCSFAWGLGKQVVTVSGQFFTVINHCSA